MKAAEKKVNLIKYSYLSHQHNNAERWSSKIYDFIKDGTDTKIWYNMKNFVLWAKMMGFVSFNYKHDTKNIPRGIPHTLRELTWDWKLFKYFLFIPNQLTTLKTLVLESWKNMNNFLPKQLWGCEMEKNNWIIRAELKFL